MWAPVCIIIIIIIDKYKILYTSVLSLLSLSIKIKSFIPVYCHISWVETECALVEPWSSDVLVPDLDLDEIVNIFL